MKLHQQPRKSSFPDKHDAANNVSCFHKLFVICNSKQRFNSSNELAIAVVLADNKPAFLSNLADRVESWSKCVPFTLTSQTSHALVTTTLRVTSHLISELLNEGYDYVLTSRLQRDPLERHFSKYRQMSGGRFLVSLREVNNSEQVLALSSILKENIDLWEEEIYVDETRGIIVNL